LYDVDPLHQELTFDSRRYVIPANLTPGEPGEWVPIPEGCAELQVGSYARRKSSDPQERKDEMNKINQVHRGRNACFEEGTKRGEWAFIEIRRQELVSQPVAVDVAKLYPGMRVER